MPLLDRSWSCLCAFVPRFDCFYYPPPQLASDGYKILNSAWTPLYMAGGQGQTPELIYNWNPWLFGEFPGHLSWWEVTRPPSYLGAQAGHHSARSRLKKKVGGGAFTIFDVMEGCRWCANHGHVPTLKKAWLFTDHGGRTLSVQLGPHSLPTPWPQTDPKAEQPWPCPPPPQHPSRVYVTIAGPAIAP